MQQSNHSSPTQAPIAGIVGQVNNSPSASIVEYIPEVASAYPNLNTMYSSSPYAPAPAENIYMTTPVHSANFYPNAENIFHQYRLQGVGGYYPDYHHHHAHLNSPTYVANGFLPYDGYSIPSTVLKEEKWHQENNKYYLGGVNESNINQSSKSSFSNYENSPQQIAQVSEVSLKFWNVGFVALVRLNVQYSYRFSDTEKFQQYFYP